MLALLRNHQFNEITIVYHISSKYNFLTKALKVNFSDEKLAKLNSWGIQKTNTHFQEIKF